MPETLGFLLLSAAGITNIAGFAITAGTAAIVGNVALLGGAIGLSLAFRPSAPNAPKPQDGQITTRQSLPNRRRNYGLVKISGPLMFSETNNGTRYQMIALNQGEIDSFTHHWFDDNEGFLDGSGFVTNLYVNGAGGKLVQIFGSLGPSSDTAIGQLILFFPTLWTTAHKGNGIAKVLICTSQPASSEFTKVYPGGQPPVYRAVIQSTRVWDPRATSNRNVLAYSTNPILIALDFHRHADGMGLAVYDDVFFTDDAINQDWIPAANICDEAVLLKDGVTTIPRYQCSGGYDLPSAPKDTLAAILSTCDGQTYQRSDGAIGIRVGKTIAPTVTIQDNQIVGYESLRSGPVDSLTGINRITAKYTDTGLDFQEVDADPWDDVVSIAETGRLEIRDLPLQWVPAHAQARRLMKLAMHRANPEWSGRVTTNLAGLQAWGERYINLQITELGIDGTFELTAPPEFMPASMTVVLTVASLDASAFSWNPLTEEGTQPDVPSQGSTVDTVLPPTSITLVSTTGRVVTFSWSNPVRIDEVADAQYSIHNADNWFDASVNPTNNGASTPAIAAGTYDLRARYRVGTNSSSWLPLVSVVVV